MTAAAKLKTLANGIGGVDLGVGALADAQPGLIQQAADAEKVAQIQAAGFSARRDNSGGYVIQKDNANPTFLRNLESLKGFTGVMER